MRHYVKCLFLALMMAVGSAAADTLTIPYSFTPGETITAAKFNSNFGAVTTVVNGNLDDNNIKVGANIATSKLNLTSELPVLRSASNRCVSAGVTGDTVPRVSMTSSGLVSFGAGSSSAQDMAVKREDANTIAIRDAGDTTYKNFKAAAITGTTGTFSGALSASSLTLTTPYATGAVQGVCNGRLTLTTGTPITTNNVTAATTVYFSPYGGNQIGLYDGSSRWNLRSFSELSASLSGLAANTNYDVFVYDNAGTAAIDTLTAWTNDSTRATALILQDGVLVKSGATTRRYVGTIRTTATIGQCEDSTSRRFVWNYYNRVVRNMQAIDTTNTWTYNSTTFRQFNNSTTDGVGQVSFVIGVSEGLFTAKAYGFGQPAAASTKLYIGIGIDSSTVNSAQIKASQSIDGGFNYNGSSDAQTSEYQGVLSAGKHTVAPLEADTGNYTLHGDDGNTNIQSGLLASMEM